MTSGGRNLVLLGIISTAIAVATTSVSLIIYHNSGDIYLDRSRPGYLPDEDEVEQDENSAELYEFDKSGPLTHKVLDEYLENLEKEIEALDAYASPFNSEALSDEALGITDAPSEEN